MRDVGLGSASYPMRQYHVIPSTGSPAKGPLSAEQVVAMYEQAQSTAQMLIWWKDQKGWDKIIDHIEEIRMEVSDARPTASSKPAPAAGNGVPAGQVLVTRDGVEIGAFHESDAPALLRAKVLQPTDLYLSASMSKPAPLSELLLALLLKPAAQPAAPTASGAGQRAWVGQGWSRPLRQLVRLQISRPAASSGPKACNWIAWSRWPTSAWLVARVR